MSRLAVSGQFLGRQWADRLIAWPRTITITITITIIIIITTTTADPPGRLTGDAVDRIPTPCGCALAEPSRVFP